MNVNPIIEAAFKDFEVPIAFLNYTGRSETYLTYYTWLQKPENFSDDEYHVETIYLTVDIWSKTNFKNILKQVKQTLKQNGFTWADNGPETFEKETGYFHVSVNFYYEGGTD